MAHIIKLQMKPLFIPLKTEFYEQFVNGTKPNMEEYRIYGPRWNEKTCPIGRPVVVSKGYGIRNRRTGMVVGFEAREEPTRSKAWIECYGDSVGHKAACIRIQLDEVKP